MRGNGASFGIVTEFVVRLRDMPNDGIIRSAPILWAADKAKDVMTSWMGRIGRADRRDTETFSSYSCTPRMVIQSVVWSR